MKRTSLLCVLLVTVFLQAQPPAPANPQAPTLNPLPGLGMQRGKMAELTLTGTNLAEPTGVWTSFPAKVTIPAEKDNGKSPTSLRIRLEVPGDAPAGFHSVRVATKKGISNARLFCLDDLLEVAELATNHDIKTAQAVTAPCVVAGKAEAEQTDYFKFPVKPGQRLCFEVLGRRLGSAFDPQLTLLDSAGKELPGGHSNDAPGLQTDPRLTYVFKSAGEVVVAIRDVSYRGGADYHYRLRIGDFPCATVPLPMAIKQGTKATIQFAGPLVQGIAPVEVQAPNDPYLESMQVTPRSSAGVSGWPVLLAVSDLDEQLEKEPNNDPKQANRITVPSAITGRFEQKDDLDHYVFALKKGQRIITEAHTAELLSPTEVFLALRDAKGTQLVASNPQVAPRLDFTAPADGDYTLVVEHLHSWGGPDEVYRITVTPYQPDFALTLNLDRWDLPALGKVSVPIFATRNGYTGPIEISVTGAKGISGAVTIPAGPAKPANVPSATLEIKAEDLPLGPLSVQIVGKGTQDGKALVRLASTRTLVAAALGNLPVPPRHMVTQVGLAITPKPPFTLTLEPGTASVQPGKPLTATIKIARGTGFVADVAVSFQGLPPGVKAEPMAIKIPGKDSSIKVTLTPPTNAKPGPFQVSLVATAKHDGRDWSVRSAPVMLTVKK